ncbi:MAG: FAD-linked oxidase C-terminal domain-containing protein, partial [Balneolales bacterium]
MSQPVQVYDDELTRRLYANDASMYEELPVGVAFPKSKEDIRQLIQKAIKQKTHITARAAGTSLAGQTTGGGIIMDASRYMTNILEINTVEKYAHVQPGVIRDQLNREAGKLGLLFGPDTSTTNRCMIGGMIGNNSSGSYSIKYKTTRDNIIEVEAVLSDGSEVVFGPVQKYELKKKLSLQTLEGKIYREMLDLLTSHKKEIRESYPHPEIIRRNTGYALDKLCEMEPITSGGRPFNLAELLCGSEGTLAMTTSAKVNLVQADKHKVLLIAQFGSLDEALKSTVEVVKLKPSAVELVDNIILDATKGNTEQRRNRFFLEGEPRCLLIIEFEGNDPNDLTDRAKKLQNELVRKRMGYAHPIITDPEKIGRVWELRRAGLGLLMGASTETKTPTFTEDTSVRVEDLPAYVRDFRKILEKHKTPCVFYAHASVGELHLRPAINIKSPNGVQTMKVMADEIADLVRSYRGSLSGEHGDGRARANQIGRVLGDDMIRLLKQVKTLWDPSNIFNPGKITDPKPMEADLRFSPEYKSPDVDTVFHWRAENGFAEALEMCNGAGVCRKKAESGGTMCPSYMATLEEKDSTRGRANVFRQIFATRQSEGYQSQEVKDALDLCLSCKACKTECPANVDMARMKAEFLNGWHAHKGISLSERFFGEPAKFYPLASKFHFLVNEVNKSRPGKEVLRWVLGIHPKRNLPEFSSQTFMEWYKHRGSGSVDNPDNKVVLLVDYFMNYHDMEIGKAMVMVLEKLGYQVLVIGPIESGRTHISKGLLPQARKIVVKNVERLYPYAQNYPLIGQEPSEILTFRDESLDLCNDDQMDRALKVASQAYMFEEFINKHVSSEEVRRHFDGKQKEVHVHGHCHAKALVGIEPTMDMLTRTGYDPVDMKTGCCGMAGSFGYEERHYDVSMNVGELKLFP